MKEHPFFLIVEKSTSGQINAHVMLAREAPEKHTTPSASEGYWEELYRTPIDSFDLEEF